MKYAFIGESLPLILDLSKVLTYLKITPNLLIKGTKTWKNQICDLFSLAVPE